MISFIPGNLLIEFDMMARLHCSHLLTFCREALGSLQASLVIDMCSKLRPTLPNIRTSLENKRRELEAVLSFL
jgi:hypothetical protein